jgi:D-alanine-D-alanine ligase
MEPSPAEKFLPQQKRTRMLVLAGGRSDEHEVSIMSARTVIQAAADSSWLCPSLIVITCDGGWLSQSEGEEALKTGRAIRGGNVGYLGPPLDEISDVVFPLIHGWKGGDGSVQGFLEMANIPYVGSGILSTALCMDKPSAKEIVSVHGIPVVRHVNFTKADYLENPNVIIQCVQQLKVPWFVKPANLGSSIGVSKVTNDVSLHGAINKAMQYDRRIMVEEGVPDAREFEVAVFGNDNLQTTPVGEVLYDGEFYDYESKYTLGKSLLKIPADISEDIVVQVKSISLQAYRLLDCAGFARVDFLFNPQTQELFFNEVNSSPGFTPYSAFPKLMKAAGQELVGIIEIAVELGLSRHSLKGKRQNQ